MGGNPIQFDFPWLFIIPQLLGLVFFLVFFVLVIYFMVSAIKYFKHKSTFDQELLQKVDELIRLQAQNSDHKS